MRRGADASGLRVSRRKHHIASADHYAFAPSQPRVEPTRPARSARRPSRRWTNSMPAAQAKREPGFGLRAAPQVTRRREFPGFERPQARGAPSRATCLRSLDPRKTGHGTAASRPHCQRGGIPMPHLLDPRRHPTERFGAPYRRIWHTEEVFKRIGQTVSAVPAGRSTATAPTSETESACASSEPAVRGSADYAGKCHR